MGANDAIRVGVAGVNGMGWGHVERFRSLEGVRVAAICDPDRRLLPIETVRGRGYLFREQG